MLLPRLYVATAAVAALVLGAAPTASGQPQSVLRLTMVDGNGVLIQGAMVSALGSDGLRFRQIATRPTVTLRLPAGSYRIRVDRIGFRSFVSEPIQVAGGSSAIRLVVESPRVVLKDLEVSGSSPCGPTSGSTRLAAAWSEVRKALEIQIASRGALADEVFRRVSFRRTYDTNLLRLSNRADTATGLGGGGTPFTSAAPSDLSRLGFLRREGAESLFLGPTEEVLLSDEFLQDHCWQLGKSSSNTVIVEFTPVPGRSIPDIRGSLTLDAVSARLQTLEFTYVNLPQPYRDETRGWVEFATSPSGLWYVTAWSIRLPTYVRRYVDAVNATILVRSGYSEDGGIAVPLPR